MKTSELLIYVVSHDVALLNDLPKRDFLVPTLLGELGLPQELAGNQLAENRFLLTNLLTDNEASQVGFISARWNERFPTWPHIQELDALALSESDDARSYFAPQTILATGPQVKNWIKAQDAVHPGTSSLLFELLDVLGADNLSDRSVRGISMGNNFIVTRDVALELLSFWQAGFNHLYKKYGFDLPFDYRCASCGLVSHQGVGRWDRSRHAGFLFERVTALFFATRTDLVALEPHNGSNRKVRRSLLAHAFALGPLFFRIYKTLTRFGRRCDHAHEALGKKK